MKKLLLVILLLAAALYLAGQWYTIKSARSTDGTYNVVIINTESGKIYKVMGK